jgi:hypothetical protein
MRTLIRASQIHPDISGTIIEYTSGRYPNYSSIGGVSGVSTSISGSSLLLSLSSYGISNVSKLNSLSGNVLITGESGIYARTNNQTIYIGYSGGVGGSSAANVSGYGNVDVWPINSSTIAVSGISITGANGIETLYNPYKTLLTVRGVGLGKLNNKTGDISLVGRNGAEVSVSGQSIYIDANQAAFSGVNSINGLKGNPVSVVGTLDININTNTGLNTIFVGYTGMGWGNDQLFAGTNTSVNYIGNQNTFNKNAYSLINGNKNTLIENTGVSTLNSQSSQYFQNNNSTFINVTGGTFTNITGSTIINGMFGGDKFKYPYAVGMGGSVENTFSTNMHMKTFLSGKQIVKALKVPKTNYSGIFVQTGSVLFGEINYVAVRYDMTDFDASFDAKNYGIYGKKYFMVQRATNLQVEIKDESDLFGGNGKYNLFISGGNDERLYLFASGYSGSDPGDGIDGVHYVIFMASLNFVNFSISPYVD